MATKATLSKDDRDTILAPFKNVWRGKRRYMVSKLQRKDTDYVTVSFAVQPTMLELVELVRELNSYEFSVEARVNSYTRSMVFVCPASLFGL